MKTPVFMCNKKQQVAAYSHPWRGDGHFYADMSMTLQPGEGLVAFRRDFTLPESTQRVLLKSTALGVYHLFLNGAEIGDEEMKPGWTDYYCRVFESTFDITAACRAENTLVVPVAPGWWSGRISFGEYGWRPVALAAEITFYDQNGACIGGIYGDEGWRTAIGGRVRFSDIYDGEYIDATLPDIATAPDAYAWEPVDLMAEPLPAVVPPVSEPVRVRPTLSQAPKTAMVYSEVRDNGTTYGEVVPKTEKAGDGCEKTGLLPGETLVLDLGQEMVGRPRLELTAARGTRVEIFCAELLNDTGAEERGNDGPGGSLYVKNYRTALARTVYIAAGEDIETVCAKYCFFGFRYLGVRVSDRTEIHHVMGDFLSTDMEETGYIETSSPEVNRLFENILWGQRCNYLSVPTDCPQRDERLGWTGDTQIFAGAGTYNANARAFLRKWLGDARDGQRLSPGYHNVIPVISALSTKAQDATVAWGDAPVIVPYRLYLKYNDLETLAEHYDSMEAYMAYLASLTPAGPRERFGDWLAYEETPQDLLCACFYAYDASLMATYAAALGKPDRAAHYRALFEEIKVRFAEKYLREDMLTVSTQTACLVALRYGLLEGKARENTVALLAEKLRANNYTLSTGFIGTGILNQTLSEVGLDGLAYSLLLQTVDPSWLYSVRQGATTVWERWNSYTKATGFGQVSMNSFNHYAYGAVAEWMYESMAGIKADPAHPGFKRFILAPRPDLRCDAELPEGQERITFVRAHYVSAAGRIESAWEMKDGEFLYTCTIPEGTAARVEFPLTAGQCSLTVNGATCLDFEKIGNTAVLSLPAGKYILK